ncbi:hypothetical protein HW132_33500, partial [Brasilonema sp. CT11]|nr:hypothetical protein [Brasilonema sp. CT11]
MNNDTSTFDIRNFSDQLEPAKEKGKCICPVCGGHNLGIDEKTGKYNCFNGCKCKDIREALKPWAEVLQERKQQDPNGKMINTPLAKKTASPHKPASTQKLAVLPPVPLPQGKLAIARLSEVPTDIPKKTQAKVTEKEWSILQSRDWSIDEIKQTDVTFYDYGSGKEVRRFEAPCDENIKGRKKTFIPYHIDNKGKTIPFKGNDKWSAYRQDEAIASALAVDDGSVPVILFHEGEKVVEAGRAEKLAGMTAQGTPSEKDLVYILNEIKQKMGDRSFILAYCADNDDPGKTKAETLAKEATRSQVPLVLIDLKAIFPELCQKGDVVDILENGMNGDKLAELILEQIYEIKAEQNNVEAKLKNNKSENPYDKDPNDKDPYYSPYDKDPYDSLNAISLEFTQEAL